MKRAGRLPFLWVSFLHPISNGKTPLQQRQLNTTGWWPSAMAAKNLGAEPLFLAMNQYVGGKPLRVRRRRIEMMFCCGMH
jgi:hypothetical protein